MNGFRAMLRLAWRYLAARRLATGVSVSAIALSLAFVVGVGIVNFGVKKSAVEGAIRYPLLIGPSGSSGIQLILSSIFHIDKPSGTLPFRIYEEIAKDERVLAAYPIAMADSYENIRLIGTSEAFLKDLRIGARSGRLDLTRSENAVFGAQAAKQAEVAIGDTFHGQHGMVGTEEAHEHAEVTYRVVGILNPTGGPEDNAIYTSVAAVWAMHAAHEADEERHQPVTSEHAEGVKPHHDAFELGSGMLTAVLVRTANPVYTGELEREYSLRDGTVAVDTGRSMREFVSHLSKGEVVVEWVSAGMLGIAFALILVTLLMSLTARRKELALLRMLGVSRATLALTVMFEALALTLAGTCLGLSLGHVAAFAAQAEIQNALGFAIEPLAVTRLETIGVVLTLVAGQVLAGSALMAAYRLNVVEESAKD